MSGRDVALESLWEAAGLPDFDLPDDLRALYGGSLGFRRPCLYANFVATLDGIVTLSGNVRSEAERERAVRLAHETRGVSAVVDRLRRR